MRPWIIGLHLPWYMCVPAHDCVTGAVLHFVLLCVISKFYITLTLFNDV